MSLSVKAGMHSVAILMFTSSLLLTFPFMAEIIGLLDCLAVLQPIQ